MSQKNTLAHPPWAYMGRSSMELCGFRFAHHCPSWNHPSSYMDQDGPAHPDPSLTHPICLHESGWASTQIKNFKAHSVLHLIVLHLIYSLCLADSPFLHCYTIPYQPSLRYSRTGMSQSMIPYPHLHLCTVSKTQVAFLPCLLFIFPNFH